MLYCSWCGSQRLAWIEEGYVVCQSCGTIVSGLQGVAEEPSRAQLGHVQRVKRLARRVAEDRGFLGSPPPSAPGQGAGSPPPGAVLAWRRSGARFFLANRRARDLLRSNTRLSFIAGLVNGDPLLKARSLRTRVALAMYLDLRSRGYSKKRSLRMASLLAGSSESSLERVISKYRDRIEILEKRILG
jgi:transcription initiation factor TFIIIB Brf1 subunit/transcription initiation factor TFIIB